MAVWTEQMNVRREADGVPGGVEDEGLAEERVDLLDDARVVDERLEAAAVLALPDVVELAPAVEQAVAGAAVLAVALAHGPLLI